MKTKNRESDKDKLIKIIRDNVVLVIIVLLGLWSILLQLEARHLMDETAELSSDIERIRQEQSHLAEKLDQWQEEIGGIEDGQTR